MKGGAEAKRLCDVSVGKAHDEQIGEFIGGEHCCTHRLSLRRADRHAGRSSDDRQEVEVGLQLAHDALPARVLDALVRQERRPPAEAPVVEALHGHCRAVQVQVHEELVHELRLRKRDLCRDLVASRSLNQNRILVAVELVERRVVALVDEPMRQMGALSNKVHYVLMLYLKTLICTCNSSILMYRYFYPNFNSCS